ncbi:hypothetical protein [Maribellus sediminis]|uniref:hypothetical protein n=1 Tax=Maribellus sediminis TaxID=2696285 RepID=UPI001431ABBB|nr:hypothetical protein [Maribellus sediminis]
MKLTRFLTILLLTTFTLKAVALQDTTSIDSKNTPYELLSSYYSEHFHPFKKGNFYTGLAFSVTDNKMTHTDYLVQKVVDGDKQNFDILVKGGYYTGDYGMALINVQYFQDKFEGIVFRAPDTLQSSSITRGFAVTPSFRESSSGMKVSQFWADSPSLPLNSCRVACLPFTVQVRTISSTRDQGESEIFES